MGGVHRVVAAVIEEVADVMCLKHLDQAFVFRPVFLDALELVTRGAECTARRVAQRGDRAGPLLAGIDHVLGERADDAVAAGIDVGDLRAMFARGLDDPAGRGVDHGGDAAGLGVKRVSSGHSSDTSGLWSEGASA